MNQFMWRTNEIFANPSNRFSRNADHLLWTRQPSSKRALRWARDFDPQSLLVTQESSSCYQTSSSTGKYSLDRMSRLYCRKNGSSNPSSNLEKCHSIAMPRHSLLLNLAVIPQRAAFVNWNVCTGGCVPSCSCYCIRKDVDWVINNAAER